MISLSLLRQEKGERFSKVALKIKKLNPEVVLLYMVMALKKGSFVDNLYMHELRLQKK